MQTQIIPALFSDPGSVSALPNVQTHILPKRSPYPVQDLALFLYAIRKYYDFPFELCLNSIMNRSAVSPLWRIKSVLINRRNNPIFQSFGDIGFRIPHDGVYL